jgi:ubiquinone/menaquinone biosynthesis C-methylase UbiE
VVERERRDLVKAAAPAPGGVWADLGAGEGAFTLCLAAELGTAGLVWAVDRDAAALESLAALHRRRGEAGERLAALRVVRGDFRMGLDLGPLDGVLMANSLHYVEDPRSVLAAVAGVLGPSGVLLLIEYDSAAANPWVPYPLPIEGLAVVLAEAGFAGPRVLARVPSRYHGHIYAALARPGPHLARAG